VLLPIRVVVHGHHRVALDNAVLLREVLLCECLYHALETAPQTNVRVDTYHVVAAVTELLAHELIHPLGGLVIAAAGLHSGDYERHIGEVGC
jgi:hypothetical protein